jgi:hypothetical protein
MTKAGIVVLPLALAAAFHVSAQTVISARSGVIYFFEGSVFLGDKPLEQKFGQFPSMGEGRELRSATGRAEILLTPDVFLRIDENSGIRLLSDKLSDTRVELLGGSAILESRQAGKGNPVTLVYKGWQVQVPHDGVYRIDSEPPRLQAYQGEVEVANEGATEAVLVREGELLPLAAVLVPEQAPADDSDAFKTWVMSRSQAISADNTIAADILDGPPQPDLSGIGLSGLSYFPMVGIPSLGISRPYGLSFWSPYQSTWNSTYLPPSLYRPLYSGWPNSPYSYYPYRIGIPPRIGSGSSLPPGSHPPARFPVEPPHIGTPRGAPHGGGSHVGGHR